MMRIHDKEVNKISEYNLPHNIINPLKRAKTVNNHYSPILHGCMNTIKGRAKFKNLLIILETLFISKIEMGNLVKKPYPEKDAMIQWHTQAGMSST